MNVKERIKNKFLLSVMTLLSGSLIAQIISILLSPIMTRIYTEDQIGEYTLLLTVVNMFGSTICGRYDWSIVSEDKNDNVLIIVKLSIIVSFILSLLVSIGYSIYLSITNSIEINIIFIIILIFFLLFFTGIGNILTAYNNRNKEYKLIASVYTIKELGRGITLIIFGLLHWGNIGLTMSYIISTVLGINRQSKSIKKYKNNIVNISISQIIEIAKKHKNQPLFSVPANFINSFSYSVLNIFINQLFGIKIMAYYSMSYRMLGIPLTLISSNVSKAYFEKASRDYNEKKNFRKIYVQTSLILLIIAIPMVIFLMIFAPFLFKIFFGANWEQAGIYVRYLSPMFGIRLIVSALSPTMIICNKQRWELGLQTLFIVSSVTIYFYCNSNGTMEIFLIGISISYFIIYVIYYITMFKLSKGNI